MIDTNKIYNADNIEILKQIDSNSIDMVLTSPPYGTMRTYNQTLHWNKYIFQDIADELYRILKQGGVAVWVVGDMTVGGCETGTSFEQVLYFRDIGFSIYDTMIYRKLNYMPVQGNRYGQEFEYIFCFSKGIPKTFNPIRVPCKYAGMENWNDNTYYNEDGIKEVREKSKISDTKVHGNIFEYRIGSTQKTSKINHPAMFPIELAQDMVKTWSNENDLVLDPFVGSGTTCVVCKETNRNYIGIDIVKEYCDIANERLKIDAAKLFY